MTRMASMEPGDQSGVDGIRVEEMMPGHFEATHPGLSAELGGVVVTVSVTGRSERRTILRGAPWRRMESGAGGELTQMLNTQESCRTITVAGRLEGSALRRPVRELAMTILADAGFSI